MTSIEHICYVTSNTNTTDLDYVYLIDASSNNITLTMKDISNYNGLVHRIVRIDSNINYTVTLQAYGSQTINGSNTINLLPGYSSLLLVSYNGGWYGAATRTRTMLIPYSSGYTPITLTTNSSGSILDAALIGQTDNSTEINILSTSFSTQQAHAFSFVSSVTGYITSLNTSVYNINTLNLSSSVDVEFEIFKASSTGSFSATGFKTTITFANNESGGSILTGTKSGFLSVSSGDRILLRAKQTTSGLLSLVLDFTVSGSIFII